MTSLEWDSSAKRIPEIRTPVDNSAGNWCVAIWRPDRSFAYGAGGQGRRGVANPKEIRVGYAARELHDALLQLQGPDGHHAACRGNSTPRSETMT